jgi:hypothetical protein
VDSIGIYAGTVLDNRVQHLGKVINEFAKYTTSRKDLGDKTFSAERSMQLIILTCKNPSLQRRCHSVDHQIQLHRR